MTNAAEGYFKNGDQWHGGRIVEDGRKYFIAVTASGDEYETEEMPTRYPFMTMYRVPDGIQGVQALEMLRIAKQAA